jgi:hypothetical protein
MFLKTKQADCKSFSLAFVGMMEALGHDVGFRFASYRKNKIPTHVYNFVVCNGKKFTFDSCVENLKESPRYTFIKDMKVQYLSGPNYIGITPQQIEEYIKGCLTPQIEPIFLYKDGAFNKELSEIKYKSLAEKQMNKKFTFSL